MKRLLGVVFTGTTYRRAERDRVYKEQIPLFEGSRGLVDVERKRRELVLIRSALREEDSEDARVRVREVTRLIRDLQRTGRLEETEETHTYPRCPACSAGISVQRDVCLSCDLSVCIRCGKEKEEGHVCVQTDLESVETIRKECRMCVNCSVPSVRVEGCAVMWCVRCNTFWNWDTMRRIDSLRQVPHNPDHRRSLMWGNQREVHDIPCGGIPTPRNLLWQIRSSHGAFPTAIERAIEYWFVSMLDIVMNAQALRAFLPRTLDVRAVTEKERVQYLIGDISRVVFCRRTERSLQIATYRVEVHSILSMFVLLCTDVLQRFEAGEEQCSVTMKMLNTLRGIANTSLMDARKRVSCGGPVRTFIIPAPGEV